MNLSISSVSNPKIKWVKSLHKNSTRRDENVIIVEGSKEVRYALDNDFLLHSLFVCPEIHGEVPSYQSGIEVYSITRSCYEKIAYRGSTDGLVAVFHAKHSTLDTVNMKENPFFIVVESIEKPGNLGAIIRTADGAGADGVIICDEKADIYNPNVIRSSVGTVFSQQVISAKSSDVIDFLNKHEIMSFGAILSDESANYTTKNYTGASALVLGTEHDGLSDIWQNHSTPIQIPMHGTNDSLNVSNAAAILAYEVVRQRTPSLNG